MTNELLPRVHIRVQAAITERATAVIFVFTQYKDKTEDDLFLCIIHT